MPKTSRRFAAAEAAAPVGYTPPANPEAEQSVLGAILVRPEVLDRVADVIGPADFYREAHGRIYQAMLDLYGRGEPVDLVTVTALLKERGQLEGVGGPVFLAGLSEQVGFATNADYYAAWCTTRPSCAACWTPPRRSPPPAWPRWRTWPSSWTTPSRRSSRWPNPRCARAFQPVGALVEKEIATLEAIWHREAGRITGVPSGFTDLDNLTAGFQNSDLIIIAARPSMGKTALALNIAFNAPRLQAPQVPVAFFSLEMSKEQLVRRLLSSEGGVDASQSAPGLPDRPGMGQAPGSRGHSAGLPHLHRRHPGGHGPGHPGQGPAPQGRRQAGAGHHRLPAAHAGPGRRSPAGSRRSPRSPAP